MEAFWSGYVRMIVRKANKLKQNIKCFMAPTL